MRWLLNFLCDESSGRSHLTLKPLLSVRSEFWGHSPSNRYFVDYFNDKSSIAE